jgi:hypothetical protein
MLGAAACAGPSSGLQHDATPEPYGDVGIEVTNLNFLDANLYVLTGSNRTRLGTVRSNEREMFRFAYAGPEVRIEISFIGGGSYVSDRVTAQPGDVLELRIDPSLDRKTWLQRR